MTTSKMSSGEMFLRWLRTLPPAQADLVAGEVADILPSFTAEWVEAARRLVVDENNEEIRHLCNLLFARLGETPRCIFCTKTFVHGLSLWLHRSKCNDRSYALAHPNEPPYVWPEHPQFPKQNEVEPWEEPSDVGICRVAGCGEIFTDGVGVCVGHSPCPYCGKTACENPHEDD